MQKEAEKRNSIWSQIVKVVDNVMKAIIPDQIEKWHIDYIENAILKYALSRLPSAKKPSQNHFRKKKNKKYEESQEILSIEKAA